MMAPGLCQTGGGEIGVAVGSRWSDVVTVSLFGSVGAAAWNPQSLETLTGRGRAFFSVPVGLDGWFLDSKQNRLNIGPQFLGVKPPT